LLVSVTPLLMRTSTIAFSAFVTFLNLNKKRTNKLGGGNPAFFYINSKNYNIIGDLR
jgi:hypothetical protein